MNYQLVLTPERIKAIEEQGIVVHHLGNYLDNYYTIDVTIDNSTDLLKVFHAGIEFGSNEMYQLVKSIKY